MLNFLRKLFTGTDALAPAVSEAEQSMREAARLKRKEEKAARKQFRQQQLAAKRKMREQQFTRIVKMHLDELYFKKKSLRFRDDYGIFLADEWRKELEYFVDKVLPVSARCAPKEKLIPRINQLVTRYRPKQTAEFKDDDPIAFERHVQKLLHSRGWDARVTKGSGDQGVDVIAKKAGVAIAIQCKLYSGAVGTSAVQEVIAGKSFYRCDYGWVVTNASFTPGAKALASKAEIVLIHYSKIHDHLSPVKNRKRANKAPEPTTMAVTPRAPSSTSRASHGRGSS